MIRLLAVLLLAAAARAEHRVLELESPPLVEYRVVRDLNGDGLDELMLVTNAEAWLWHGRRDDFPSAPDHRMKLPKGTAFFDVGPFGETLGLVARTAGAYWTLLPGKAPARLPFVSGPGLPLRPANLLWRGFFRDFDRDGKRDWIDVSLLGYRILFGGGDVVTLPPRLTEEADTSAHAASDRIVARYAIGDWTDGDFDGDGRTDFAVMTEGGLQVYPGDEKGRFDPERTLDIRLQTPDDADLVFLDLNGDGRTDVLSLERKAGKAAVLMADGERGLAAPRRTSIAIPGEIREAILHDFDGDGREDVALPFIPRPSVRMAVRAFVQGEVILKVPIFLNRGGRAPIRVRADTQISLPVRLRVATDSAGRIQLSGLVVVEYGADLTGDGHRDLVVTSKPTLLDVHEGRPGAVFEDEPTARIPIPDCSEFDSVWSAPANLDGDERADVVLLYRGAGRRPDRVVCLLSGKERGR